MNGKDAILLLILLVLVCSSTAPYEAQAVEYHNPPSYRLTAETANVYHMITPEVNQSTANSAALSLFSLRTTEPLDYEGIHFVNSGNKTFEIDTRDGSMFYADYSRYYNPAMPAIDLSPVACKDVADAFLMGHELLPEGAFYAGTGVDAAAAFNPLTEEEQTRILHYQINYEFEVDGMPVTGPGAQIAVTVGAGLDIVAFDWNWRELEVVDTIPLIEYESLLEMYGISPANVRSHTLAYYAGPDDDNEDYLFPVYEIELEIEEGDETVQVFPKLSATEFTPEATITSPADGATFQLNSEIIFNCSVVNGEAPYTYAWSSSYIGFLSNERFHVDNYGTSGASTGRINEEQPDPDDSIHTITLKVVDANGLMSMDFININIAQPIVIDTAVLVIAGVGILVILLLGITSRKRGKLWVLFLMIALLSAFTLVPLASASEDSSGPSPFLPSAPSGDYDDGVKEVGIEWVGLTGHPPLGNTQTNIEGFYNWMNVFGGYDQEFNWGEYSAWEEDFKYEGFGGTDNQWVDAVDFVYYQDHGNPDGVAFSSSHDDGWLHYSECKWGDGDLEWIVLDACSPLAWENENSENVWERWAPALQGLHMILSFSTGSNNVQTRGWRFGMYLTGFMFTNKMSLADAWFRACAETQGSTCYAAVLYASKSADPWNPQLDDPINDHAHGFGYQCSDPTPETINWYVYITSQC
ncbi:MAG: DUF6345 domain-containing protein [Candidatus Thorarchaeota archaeon]